MKIYLYSVISSKSEQQKIARSLLDGLKLKIHFLVNSSLWSLLDKFNFKFYQYMEFNDTNSGDVAIRISIEELLEKVCPEEDIVFEEIPWGGLDEDTIRNINTDGTFFIIGGSGYYHHDTEGRMNQRFLDDFQFVKKIQCPVITYGVGMNRKLTSGTEIEEVDFPVETMDLIRQFTKKLSLSSVRDEYSQKTLLSLSPDVETMLISDPALFLEAEDSSIRLQTDKLKIGLNFAFHGPFCESVLKQNMSIYIDFLLRLKKEFSPEFYYFQHSDSEKVIPEILRVKGIQTHLISLSPKKMLYVYKQLDVHICQMMHSSILCCNSGTPAFNLAYDRKNISFYELMKFTEFQIPVHSVNSNLLFEKCHKMIIERDALRAHLVDRKKQLWEIEKNFLNKLFTLNI